MNGMRLPIAVYTLCWWCSMAEKIGRALCYWGYEVRWVDQSAPVLDEFSQAP